eukprot:368868-Alexandrium_andersonii.AAC.1
MVGCGAGGDVHVRADSDLGGLAVVPGGLRSCANACARAFVAASSSAWLPSPLHHGVGGTQGA